MKPTIFYNFIKQQNLFFVLLFFVGTIQAQTTPEVLWAKRYGGPNADVPNGIVTDALGNIYITGTFSSSIAFGGTILSTGLGKKSSFVAKTNSLGNVIWAKQFGGDGTWNNGDGITIDNSENIYSIGNFTGVASFDQITLDSGNRTNIFVVKQNPSGDVLWATQFIGTGNSGQIRAKSIVADTHNNVYTAGYFNSESIVFGDITLTRTGVNEHGFVVKQDDSGNVIWTKKFGEIGSVFIHKITTDSSNNIYITGNFTGTANFGDFALNSTQGVDIFLVKLNSLGETIWAKHIEISPSFIDYFSIYGATVDEIDNVYIAGKYKGTLNVGTTTLTTTNSENIFVIKSDSSGEILWAKEFLSNNYSYGSGIIVDTSGKIYVTGGFQGIIDLDGINLTNNYQTTTDIFVLKMDNLGNVEWAVKYGYTGYDSGSDVIIDATGNLLVFGNFEHNVAFGNTSLTSAGNRDLFLLKLSPNALSTQKNQINNLSVSPNPTDNFLTLHFPDLENETFSVEIFNLLGQKIKTFENLNNAETIDLSQLTSGIYLLKINDNQTTQTIKIKKL